MTDVNSWCRHRADGGFHLDMSCHVPLPVSAFCVFWRRASYQHIQTLFRVDLDTWHDWKRRILRRRRSPKRNRQALQTPAERDLWHPQRDLWHREIIFHLFLNFLKSFPATRLACLKLKFPDSDSCLQRDLWHPQRATCKRKSFRFEQYPFRVHVGFSETVRRDTKLATCNEIVSCQN